MAGEGVHRCQLTRVVSPASLPSSPPHCGGGEHAGNPKEGSTAESGTKARLGVSPAQSWVGVRHIAGA